MTIFDYIKDITVTKTGKLPMQDYVPFLVNRWIAFLNPAAADFINSYCNSKILLENKEMHYQLLVSSFPRLQRCPRINYIKKVKEKEQELDKRILALAQNLEISIREASVLLS